MALKLKSQETPAEEKKSPAKLKSKSKLNTKATAKAEAPAEKAPVVKSSFLKRGKAAKEALAQEQVAAAVRQEQRDNEVFRYYMKAEQERVITFLDGGLDVDGDLDSLVYYEHTINNPALKYPKYVCINDPANGVTCPICDSGNQPYFATVFTVLTHETWHSKKEKKDFEGSIQLFVAKQGVADKLRKKAKKYANGLAGATFEVTRTNADAYNVGDDYDYVQTDTLEDLQAAFPDVVVAPLDYDEVIKVHTVEELNALGFGTASTAVGGEEGVDEDEVLE